MRLAQNVTLFQKLVRVLGFTALHGPGCRMPKYQNPIGASGFYMQSLFHRSTEIFNSKFTVWQVLELANPYSGNLLSTKLRQAEMVWFQCEDCGDNLKKPKLPNHFRMCSASKVLFFSFLFC